MADPVLTPIHDWLVALRRTFHQHPELAFREEETTRKIAEVLTELGVPFETGIGRTGIVATLSAAAPGPIRAFRADMDALPLEEANAVPYRSQVPGVMHACGHDAHITVALGVLRTLIDHGWPKAGRGKVVVFFQPAEEAGGGAEEMIKTGILGREPIAVIFAGHMQPELPAGEIAMAREVSNAASDGLRIRITGKGGHGAYPHLCIDPIVAGAAFVTQLQSIISRSLSPLDSAVITIGKFQAGTASNIIPHEVNLSGTLRTLDPEVRSTALQRLEALLKGLEAAYGVTTELRLHEGYPVLANDPRVVRYAVDVASELLGVEAVHIESPRMGAEDFAYFLQQIPGALLRVGCHDPAVGFTHALHSPYFNIDERALDVGVRLFSQLLTRFDPQRLVSSERRL